VPFPFRAFGSVIVIGDAWAWGWSRNFGSIGITDRISIRQGSSIKRMDFLLLLWILGGDALLSSKRTG
jgi:hypothetical protein